MLTETELINFIDNNKYDIRISKNGRWIDQKCTPDVISFISDCILQFIDDPQTPSQFTKNDIWQYPYSEEYILDVFSKPSTKSEKLTNEYDKFFSQPLKLLAYAGVLDEVKKGNSNVYTIKNKDVLGYLAVNERNSTNFIYYYSTKVLNDSGLFPLFKSFFDTQTRESFDILKENFIFFMINNTKITKPLEPSRIFTKVINPIAYKLKKRGTKKGNLSKSIITFSDLMYNQENFRDLYREKPKGISRVEWAISNPPNINKNWFKYESQRAKRSVRQYNEKYNGSLSEVYSENDTSLATQIHHIFPEHEFHEIAMYHENLISLTPNQHLTKAHPNNNTKKINKSYQKTLLKEKAKTILDYTNREPSGVFYSYDRLVEIINIGLGFDYNTENNTYETVMKILEN